MGAKYTTQATSGYNNAPPSDDGSETEANKVKYSTIKTKLADPEKTRSDSMDAALLALLDEGPDTKSTTYTTVATDHNKVIECSGTFTLSLLDAATAGAGYRATVKNNGSGTITVDTDTVADEIDGEVSFTLAAKESVTCIVNNAADGYYRETSHIALDINGTTELTAPAGNDELVVYDITASANRKLTLDNLITGAVELTSIADDDELAIYDKDATEFKKITRLNLFAGKPLQRVEATPYATYASSATTMPQDNSIPQNTEGFEVITLAITPTATSNGLVIKAAGFASASAAGHIGIALFQDSTAGALKSSIARDSGVGEMEQIYLEHEMTAGTTSETTFKIRVGHSSGTTYFNGNNSNRIHGGVAAWTLSIEEIS